MILKKEKKCEYAYYIFMAKSRVQNPLKDKKKLRKDCEREKNSFAS